MPSHSPYALSSLTFFISSDSVLFKNYISSEFFTLKLISFTLIGKTFNLFHNNFARYLLNDTLAGFDN